jgi:hypothetical protein
MEPGVVRSNITKDDSGKMGEPFGEKESISLLYMRIKAFNTPCFSALTSRIRTRLFSKIHFAFRRAHI